MGEPDIVSAIVLLGLAINPTAIARFVVALIVDAVNRVLGAGAWPHVGHEQGERTAPAIAHGNPTSAVILELVRVGVITPRQHRSPHAMLQRLAAAVGCHALSGKLTLKTTTRRCVPGGKMRRWHRHLVPASASAKVPSSSMIFGEFFDHRKPSEGLPKQVVPTLHGCMVAYK